MRPDFGLPLAWERYGLWTLLAVLASCLIVHPAWSQAPANPFAVGGLEGAGGAPGSGIAAFILARQAEFNRAMTVAARAIRTDWTAVWGLAGVAFAYGVFHAAGPGHGKAIVASYVVANENALKRGIVIAALAALLQGIVAVMLVAAIAVALQGTRQIMTGAVNWIETVSYASIAAFGSMLFLRKLAGLRALWTGQAGALASHGHFHIPGPDEVMKWSLRDAAAAVFAAGLRPCSGAILILIFTLSQGIFWAGIAAVAAMSLGVALTTGGVAALAVYFKALAVRLAAGRGAAALWLTRSLEAAAALAVMLLGIALLMGLWAAQ